MSTPAFEVQNMRIGPWGPVQAFFNLSFGYEDASGEFVGLFTVRDFALKPTRDGGFWIQGPSKQRLDKDKNPVLENGYPKYDEYFDLYKVDGAGKDGGFGATKEALAFRRTLVDAVVAKFSKLSGGGAAKPKSAAKSKIEEPAAGSPLEEDDDPFAGF